MSEELIMQVRELLKQNDQESLRYILCDQSKGTIQDICAKLTLEQGKLVNRLYKQSQPQGFDKEQEIGIAELKEKNKKIDDYLLQSRQNGEEKRQENFLQMLTKLNEKLIYEQHFGFPYYDLLKRIMTTHGDLHPQPQTVKAMHSQVQILYCSLFGDEVVKFIKGKYSSLQEGLNKYLEYIFPKEYEQYYRFQAVYKNLKKSTEEEQSCDDQEQSQENPEIPLSQDQTLHLDQKEFLVNLAEGIPVDQFNQFIKNRSYNFLCFGLKKYLAFLSIEEPGGSALKKSFAELSSFMTVRFIRKLILEIIRQRGNGKLLPLKSPITAQQIKTVGNECTDAIEIRAKRFLIPVLSIEDEAKDIFQSEFQTMNYLDFLPRKFITEAKNEGMDLAEYVWNSSKEYRTLWTQRVKAERYLKEGQKGPKPMLQYVDYIINNLEDFRSNSPTLWKQFIMKKLGYQIEKKQQPVKRMKLNSLND